MPNRLYKSLIPGSRGWNEVLDPRGEPRESYRAILGKLEALSRNELRRLDDGMEATLREMGVTFSIGANRAWGAKAWECDLLPQIFPADEWAALEAGSIQRMEAFELFLRDIHGERSILREGVLPVQVVLGSPYFQRPACSLPLPSGSFLHLSGLAVVRTGDGVLRVRHHYFANASGVSYMMQNRRALARVMTPFFEGHSIRAIVDAPTDILESLRSQAQRNEPVVVLLSPGPASAVYSEHLFLARRMGIPLVQGSDLLVHDDRVFLRTISGLEQVDVIYSRLADPWLDPLVFRADSLLGVPGLVQCIRKGSVRVLNAIGSQLADDRALLPFAAKIIRFYLGVNPLLPGLGTFWLGDIDQREMVLSDLEAFEIRPLYGERVLTPPPGVELTPPLRKKLLQEISKRYSAYVAQPRLCEAETIAFPGGRPAARRQDHILFGRRLPGGAWEIIPGALTRVGAERSAHVASELGGGSKDTWVGSPQFQAAVEHEEFRRAEPRMPAHFVTSRVAEAFYWAGRYLERAYSLANMIATIEALETEELNPTERQLYRPVWNKILPPLENREQISRRNISSPPGRHSLATDPAESGSIASSVLRACSNAQSVLDVLSVESGEVIARLVRIFQSRRAGRTPSDESEMARVSRKICGQIRMLVPEFFGVAEATNVGDGGWKFCRIGQLLERAVISANALSILAGGLLPDRARGEAPHAEEIRLSAFLRMLTSRDAYRRIYQMRIEPRFAAEMLWGHPAVPRSVRYCLEHCRESVAESVTTNHHSSRRALHEIDSILAAIAHTPWREMFHGAETDEISAHSTKLMERILAVHSLISDGFFSHQSGLGQSPISAAS